MVDLEVETTKFRADSLGNETEIDQNDWIEIGVFGEDEDGEETTLYLEKHRLTNGTQQLQVRVDALPVRAGIDPLHKLIDRHSDDNVTDVEVEEDAGGGG